MRNGELYVNEVRKPTHEPCGPLLALSGFLFPAHQPTPSLMCSTLLIVISSLCLLHHYVSPARDSHLVGHDPFGKSVSKNIYIIVYYSSKIKVNK